MRWRRRKQELELPEFVLPDPLPDNVIPFRRRPLPEGMAPWSPTENLEMRECDGNVHVYLEVPGACQCGEHSWDGTVSS